MLKKLLCPILSLAAVIVVASSSVARPITGRGGVVQVLAEATPALAPFQHVRFCMRYPSDCASDRDPTDRVELSPSTLKLLEAINRSVNSEIAPIQKVYGSDLKIGWTIGPKAGDCNDYAVTKRHRLIESGLPARALRLAVVRTPDQIGHLVLLVSTTDGDLVLDNLTPSIRSWQNTDYEWLKIQSRADARLWFDVGRRMAEPADLKVSARLQLAAQRTAE
ncbi:transglutaminase-like cysteine peptidase [Rhodopseudomonas palustris]|uniref:transglutaminase-like cysteine peptidase n=1 Tax=Rhodopseudomonas palustris TaxID=1076 RepID=UPI0021F3B1C7|nr:transglutaminase-like cysteine peptidase [Rhodopseudomonas palustris]UYO52406.1 transglutaminase-like cysteine peptidase [Rhodopseudomonas palustris]